MAVAPFLRYRSAMRIEQLPVVLGVLVALLAIGLLADAAHTEGFRGFRDRRRRMRAQRNRRGEALVGLGMIGMALAFIGRDTSRYGTLSALVGAVLLIAGTVMNRDYLKELLLFGGAARRQEEREPRELVPDDVRIANLRERVGPATPPSGIPMFQEPSSSPSPSPSNKPVQPSSDSRKPAKSDHGPSTDAHPH
jgi:hypothetical protein